MTTTTVLVVDADELTRRTIGGTAVKLGFALAGEATTAVGAIQLLAHAEADLVIIGNELLGIQGIEVLPELLEAGCRVVVVSSNPDVRDLARSSGAYAAVARGDITEIERILNGIGSEVAPARFRLVEDRRSGHERRVTQDWAKVIKQRRAGHDRRAGARPQETSAASA